MARKGTAERKTAETFVRVDLDLDGEGRAEVATGVGFLDHLLHLLAHHSGIDLTVEAKGDTWVDDHHTVEDTGLVLGRAFDEALGDRGAIVRFADASAPLIEALSTVVVDLGARSHLTCNLGPMPEKIGTFDVELFPEFLARLHPVRTFHPPPQLPLRRERPPQGRVGRQGAGRRPARRHRAACGRQRIDERGCRLGFRLQAQASGFRHQVSGIR